MAYVRVTLGEELRSGDMAGLFVAGRRLLIVCLDGELFAYDDRCAHLGYPLSRGKLDGDTLTCSAHHYQYDARSGCGLNPRNVRLRGYPVKLEDGQVYVNLESTGAQ